MREHQIRSCAVCRKRENQELLFRVSLSLTDTQFGGLVIGDQRGHGGRSVYIHRTVSCTAKPMDVGRFMRALRLTGGAVQKQCVDAIWNQMHQEVLKSLG